MLGAVVVVVDRHTFKPPPSSPANPIKPIAINQCEASGHGVRTYLTYV